MKHSIARRSMIYGLEQLCLQEVYIDCKQWELLEWQVLERSVIDGILLDKEAAECW